MKTITTLAFALLATFTNAATPARVVVHPSKARQVHSRDLSNCQVLLEIILRRHETRSTLMTSNRPVEDWGKLLGDIPTAGAILDRLLSRAEIIQMTGRSHRLAHRGVEPKPAKPGAKPARGSRNDA